MSSNEKKENGIYLYGIIRNAETKIFDVPAIGKENELVYTISYKDISAVVSKSALMRYEARRLYLVAHQLVLEAVMREFTVLPIRFSTISSTLDESKVTRMLEHEYDVFCRLLERLEGKKELGLKVLTREDTIYNHILNTYDDIRTLKKDLINKDPKKTQGQLRKIGEMVAIALSKEKELMKQSMLDLLNPLAEEVKINENFGERMLLNASFLVRKNDETKFDAAVASLDLQFGNLALFKYTGTLPPYNFVNLLIRIH
jgi:hypothetical protein